MAGEQTLQPGRIEIEGPGGMSLKQFVPEDAQIIFDLIDEDRDHLSQFGDETADKYKTVEDVRSSIEEPKNPDKLRFGIWDDASMVGSINITTAERYGSIAEIGYWVGAEHTGHHYAQHATEILTEYAFDNLGVDCIMATVAIGNDASMKTLERAGFKFVGLTPEKPEAWEFRLYKNSDINDLDIKVED
jgi:ribosomal-protein-alanine N-acetyltransferase